MSALTPVPSQPPFDTATRYSLSYIHSLGLLRAYGIPISFPVALSLFRAFAIISLLLLAVGAFAQAATERVPGVLAGTMRTTYFDVHYDPADPYLARLMADGAQDALLRVSKDLGYTPQPGRPFPLLVFRKHYTFLKSQSLEGSKFTVGTATSGSETIAVDASGTLALPETTLAHEITHAIMFRILGPKIASLPLWVNEGLAKYESDDISRADRGTVGNAAADTSLIALDNLETEFPKDQTDLGYAESALAIEYMVDKYGKSAPKVLLRELARTGSFDKAMIKATGLTGGAFAAEWFDAATKQYHALRVVRVATAIISAVMAVLAVVAYIVRRRQLAEAAKRWEQEEFEEALRRQQGNDWSR